MVLALLLALAAAAGADERLAATHAAADRDAWWLAAGPAAGSLSLDAHLADYRWDTSPAAVWGVQGLVGRGRLAGGLRLWRSRTTQGTGLVNAPEAPTVTLTGVELAAQVRVVTVAKVEVWGAAQGGRLHLRYAPDRVTVDPGGEPLTIDLAPIDEWTLGLGVELRRRVGRRVDVALQAERSSFALETSHRRGQEIVTERERFYNWSARLLVAWSWSLT
jgi:hypothetical protein